MAECIRCGGQTSLGGLCAAHVKAIARCMDFTAEQIMGTEIEEPALWLIDQWGRTHGLGETTTVGRSPDGGDLIILHHSISALHAQLECSDAAVARVIDRGSLNGTRVNGERIRSAKIFDGDIIEFGDVAFYLSTTKLPAIGGQEGTGRTVPTQSDDIAFVARIQASDQEVELVAREGGGVVRCADIELELGWLEFSLLRALVESARRHRGDPALSYVSSQELARELDFQSVDADSENVRELVRRVRRKVRKVGFSDLIESRQGAGYRLGWPVKA